MAELSKTPEEIKKGLKCAVDKKCVGKECLYFNEEYACIRMAQIDALALIQRLERDKNWASENYDLIREENKRLEAQVPKWISVDESMPDAFVSVLGYMTDAGEFPPVRECYRVGNDFYFPALMDRHPVSHWMPMPEPPKEGSNA